MLLIELFVVLLKLDPSIAESIDIENVSMVSVVAKDIGEFETGKDMLRSNLQEEDIKKMNSSMMDRNSPGQFELLLTYNFSTARRGRSNIHVNSTID